MNKIKEDILNYLGKLSDFTFEDLKKYMEYKFGAEEIPLSQINKACKFPTRVYTKENNTPYLVSEGTIKDEEYLGTFIIYNKGKIKLDSDDVIKHNAYLLGSKDGIHPDNYYLFNNGIYPEILSILSIFCDGNNNEFDDETKTAEQDCKNILEWADPKVIQLYKEIKDNVISFFKKESNFTFNDLTEYMSIKYCASQISLKEINKAAKANRKYYKLFWKMTPFQVSGHWIKNKNYLGTFVINNEYFPTFKDYNMNHIVFMVGGNKEQFLENYCLFGECNEINFTLAVFCGVSLEEILLRGW